MSSRTTKRKEKRWNPSPYAGRFRLRNSLKGGKKKDAEYWVNLIPVHVDQLDYLQRTGDVRSLLDRVRSFESMLVNLSGCVE